MQRREYGSNSRSCVILESRDVQDHVLLEVAYLVGKRAIRHAVYDTNYWKSFVHARLAVRMGDKGCLSLFGDKPDLHRLFAEHVSAEYRVKTDGRGRTVDEWKIRPKQFDNHWFDCLVGCAVAASIQGSVLPGTDAVLSIKPQRVKLSELQRSKR